MYRYCGKKYNDVPLEEGQKTTPESEYLDRGEFFYIYDYPIRESNAVSEELGDIDFIILPDVFYGFVDRVSNYMTTNIKSTNKGYDTLEIVCELPKEIYKQVVDKKAKETSIKEEVKETFMTLKEILGVDKFIIEDSNLVKVFDKDNEETQIEVAEPIDMAGYAKIVCYGNGSHVFENSDTLILGE